MLSHSLLSWLFETVWSTLIDHSPPGSPVLGVLQARILEWVAILFSRESFWPRIRNWVSLTLTLTLLSRLDGGNPALLVDYLPSEPPGNEAHPTLRRAIWFSQSTNSNIQFSSITQLCLTLCNPMDCSTPGFPVHRQLPELAQTHIRRVGDAIWSSHPLSSPSPPVFNLSQHQGLFQWVNSSHQVAKVELQLQHQSFQWIFRTDFL